MESLHDLLGASAAAKRARQRNANIRHISHFQQSTVYIDMTPIDGDQLVDLLDINRKIQDNCYSPYHYLLRSMWYRAHDFPDLTAGDAYKALLLSDDLRDESSEYHEHILRAVELTKESSLLHRGWNIIERPSNRMSKEIDDRHLHNVNKVAVSDRDNIAVADEIASRCYELLALSLVECGCLKSAYDFASRGSDAFPLEENYHVLQAQIVESARDFASSGLKAEHKAGEDHELSFHPMTDLPEEGTVRRELYPWNDYEPDRFSMTSLHELNRRLAQAAPKCEVRAALLPLLEGKSSAACNSTDMLVKQLGLFAIKDIAPHEIVLEERSLLTTNNRLHDTLCDACSALLPDASASPTLQYCPDCEDTVFCSEKCATLAQEKYHPAVCGKPDFDLLTKDPSPATSSSALYLGLLGRTFAMAETQNVHPLELSETRYLWGDFSVASADTSKCGIVRRLPFTFHSNISGPLHMLERMDVNIFTSQLSETWVINTLYSKFRGTASARLSTSSSRFQGPEVAAVHPLWCLANHSCAPNVKWDWAGNIKFEARGGEDVVRWGTDRDNYREGVRQGEEILSHYCDVDLPVKDRREWAAGALGGICFCKRCKWEIQQDQQRQVFGS